MQREGPIFSWFLIRFGIIIIIIIIVGGTRAQNDTCDWGIIGLEPIPSLDLDKLYNKKWYVQEIFVRRPEAVVEPTHKCFTQTLYYMWEDFGQFVEQYTEIESGRATHNTSYALYQGLGVEERAVWGVTSDSSIEQYTAVWTATDYESYGVMHWCPTSATVVDHPYERVLTFTGVPDPDPVLLEQLRGQVAALGFPTELIVQIDHRSGCDYGLCEAVNRSCCDPSVATVPPMPDFDLDLFLNRRRWYVQEIFFRDEPDDAGYDAPSCYAHWFSPKINNVIVLYEIFTLGNSSSNDVTDLTAVPRSTTGAEAAVWDMASLFPLNKFTTVITHTDYASYGVMHWCPHLENADQRAERIFALTAAPIPDQALVQELREKVNSLGFPTEHGARIHHHDDCDYEQYDDDGEQVADNNDDFDDN